MYLTIQEAEENFKSFLKDFYIKMNQVLQKYNSDNPMEYELDELNQIMSTGISVKAMAKVLGMTNEELNVITDKIEKEIESVSLVGTISV